MTKADLEKLIKGTPKEISCSKSGDFISISSNKGHFFIQNEKVIQNGKVIQNEKVIKVIAQELKENSDK